MTTGDINQRVIGDRNTVTSTGDVYQLQVIYHYNAASNFIELQLDNLPLQFEKNLIATFREKVVEQRFLVFELEPGVPANALLREVALEIKNSFLQKGLQTNNKMPILEYTGESLGDIKTKLEGVAGPAVIIFPDVFRQYLENLHSIALEAINLNIFVLVKTDMLIQSHRSKQIEPRFSVQVKYSDLYSATYLEKVLRDGLESLQTEYLLARALLKRDASEEDGYSLRSISVELKTPVNINGFLSGLKKKNNLNDIRSIIESFQDRDVEEAISTWYRNLNPYDQLLALGATFFDGLGEDQMFEVVQQLMRSIWKEDNGPAILDRIDFLKLMEFFEIVPAGSEGDQFSSKFNQQRMFLLRSAYKLHPHRIRKALRWMYELVQKSKEKKQRPEIFNEDKEWRRLESAIAVTLSDIALLDLNAVEPMMRAIASQDDEKMHLFVAKILARWHSLGETSKLLGLLNRWVNLRIGWVRVDTISQNGSKDESSSENLTSTLVLISTYAAQFDPPGNIAPEVIESLINLAQFCNYRRVQAYFKRYTIPKLVPLHTYQIEPVLTGLLRCSSSLTNSICKALVSTYEKYPNEVNLLLDEWNKKGITLINSDTGNNNLMFGERLFETIAITLGELSNSKLLSLRDIRSAWSKLQEINRQIRTYETRLIIWKNHITVSCLNPDYLRRFLATIEPKDRPLIVSLLTDIYIEQRCRIEGPSDGTYPLDGKKIPYNLFSDQPICKLEEGLKYILVTSKNEDERVIAVQAYLNFAEKIDIKLNKHISEERNKQLLAVEQSINTNQPIQPFVHEVTPQPLFHQYNFFIDEIIPILATIHHPELELFIKEMLSKIDIHRESIDHVLDFAVKYYFQGAQEQELKEIGNCLHQAFTELRKPNLRGIRKIIYRIKIYFSIPPKRRTFPLTQFLFS